MPGHEDADRMRALEARIAEAKARHTPPPRPSQAAHSQAEVAWRMVIELVAGLLIGFGIGFGIDALFGTRPVFLVIMTLLGFAAGVKTMVGSARELQERDQSGGAHPPPLPDDDEED